MLKKLWVFLMLAAGSSGMGYAQKLYLSPSDYARPQVQATHQLYPTIAKLTLGTPPYRPESLAGRSALQLPLPARPHCPQVSPAFLPAYALENPTGYSYLCRLELKAEASLPVAFWLKLGEQYGAPGTVGSPANLRMKVLRF
ncbi:MAG: hypothetical protein D6730_13660 [Bacteroidetes bacterium]|nr:MAG: hypothetical protein D6730_13660 [Bacteroidota bacterium]